LAALEKLIAEDINKAKIRISISRGVVTFYLEELQVGFRKIVMQPRLSEVASFWESTER
jgi:hypothetical protein